VAGTIRERALAVLREHGPLTLDEIAERGQIVSKNPQQSIRTALKYDRHCLPREDGRYVYLPSAVSGATVRLPVTAVTRTGERLTVGTEAITLLLAGREQMDLVSSFQITLPDGTSLTAEMDRQGEGGWGSDTGVIQLPPRFWSWWRSERSKPDAVHLRCLDGEAGRYSVEAIRSAALDVEAVAASNARLRQVAVEAVRRTRGVFPWHLAALLLARGAYHQDPPPDPWEPVLFQPPSPLCFERGMQIVCRADLTPAMWRLFGRRINEQRKDEDLLLRGLLGGLPRSAPRRRRRPARQPTRTLSTHLYRLRVNLRWMPDVWRVVEMPGEQSLEDLHLAIQDAFGWDNDHLYSIFLSGRAWDATTEVKIPLPDEYDPPTADELTLDDLDLQPKQKFLYLFDYGDQLEHDVQVAGILPRPDMGDFPRIAERHGEAPPQYVNWDDEDELDEDVTDNDIG
jgi:hypothetical protein